MSKYHYVAVELSEALSKGLSVKMAKRMNMQEYPMQLAIFGANEMAETDADTKWELLGFSNVTWDITNPTVSNEAQAAKAIGTAGITFEVATSTSSLLLRRLNTALTTSRLTAVTSL